MFPRGFDNAYAHEVERRKDEMRDAANHKLVREALGTRRDVALPVAALSLLAFLLALLIIH